MSFFQSTDEMFAKKLNERFDHAKYSLQPNFPPFSSHPTINDDLPNRIICGSIKIKPNVKKFTKTGVEFEDGTFEDDIDAVILATGYRFGFPFLDKSVIDVINNKVELYKSMFPPDLEKKTLACIGFIQPLGAIMPISEQQCRLFARVVKARCLNVWGFFSKKVLPFSFIFESNFLLCSIKFIQSRGSTVFAL